MSSHYLIVSMMLLMAGIIATSTKSRDKSDNSKYAVVTLVTGYMSPYVAGAIALGQSLVNVHSELSRVVMVTPEVDDQSRQKMSLLWKVIQVDPIACNYKIHDSVDKSKYDLSGEQYLAGMKRWSTTCTKFAAWTLTDYDRIIFMDSDMLVVAPIDDAIYGFSNASFLAAPETFPPDTFNSGFMVLNPNMKTFNEILEINQRIGSSEGGDQGVLNNGFCPNWFTNNQDDLKCGRLPWIFNVNAANFEKYNTLRKFSGLRVPSVIHFVADGKPWVVLMFEYVEGSISKIPPHVRVELASQAMQHIAWRQAYFQASNDLVPKYNLLLQIVNDNAKNKKDSFEDTEKKTKDKGRKENLSKRKKKILNRKNEGSSSRGKFKLDDSDEDVVEDSKGKSKRSKKIMKRGRRRMKRDRAEL